jgi:hypothetical protein
VLLVSRVSVGWTLVPCRGLRAGDDLKHATAEPVNPVDLAAVDGLVPRCVWQLDATITTYPIVFPDPSSTYRVRDSHRLCCNAPAIHTRHDPGLCLCVGSWQVAVLRNLTSWRHIRISGRFPQIRYFSYQTYDGCAAYYLLACGRHTALT